MLKHFLFVLLTGGTCGLGCSTATPTNQTSSIVPTNTAKTSTVQPTKGDLSTSGGTATVRKPYDKQSDDPKTTNDESNDQPLGNMGAVTLQVTNVKSRRSYLLDADVSNIDEGFELHRLYFLKGGWIDFNSCDLDEDYVGNCTDEQGRDWDIEGE